MADKDNWVGASLPTQCTLEGKPNWNLWKFQTKVILGATGVSEALEATKPEGIDQAQWIRKDAKAQGVIVAKLSDEVIMHIINCKTAYEMWTKLESIYDQKSTANLHRLQQRFFNLRYEGEGISVFISKLKAIINELAEHDEKISEKMQIAKVIMALPDSYKHFCSAWESVAETDQKMENLISRLLMEEERLNTNDDQGIALTAFKSKAKYKTEKNREKSKCYRCNKEGHFARDCRIEYCTYCKKNGHDKKNCWSNKNKCKNNKSDTDDNSKFAFLGGPNNIKKNWLVVDSGASEHMFWCRECFSEYSAYTQKKSVVIGNGEQMSAVGQGSVIGEMLINNKWHEVVFKNVLHVPDACVNLFSVNSATEKGHSVKISKTSWKFYKNNEQTAEARREGKLNVMNFRCKASECAFISWHERLVHQSKTKDILKNWGINENREVECEACIVGKMCRKSFPTSKSVTKTVGEIIHADLCGPMEVNSVGGSRYYLVLKDDYSKFRSVYFLKNKSDTMLCLQKFIANIENQHGIKIKVLRTDGGKEFVNTQMRQLVNKHGIVHQTTVAYTPEQNGVAERDMRTVVEGARTILLAKQLPKSLWAEAVNTVVYVLNRTIEVRENKTPLEMWSKLPKYDINQLKVFGSKVFVHVPKQRRLKWDSKAKAGIFVGYGENTKGYRIYFPDKNFVDIKRDVRFMLSDTSNTNQVCPKQNIVYVDTVEDEVSLASENIESADPSRASRSNSEKESESEDDESSSAAETVERRNSVEGEVAGAATAEQQQQRDGAEGISTDTSSNTAQIQRPRRITQQPKWLNDYDATSLVAYQCGVPQSYREAMQSENAKKWADAVREEIKTCESNDTWSVVKSVDCADSEILDTKWVFKIKTNDTNNELYKARLVVRGFKQQLHELDEIYAPVARIETFRIFMALACDKRQKVHQMDVKGAFLNGDINENVFIHLPEGLDDKNGSFLKLNKSLYGLKKSPKYWYTKFTDVLFNVNFERSKNDYCLFYKKN